MNIVRFNPFFSEVESLQNEFNRVFNESYGLQGRTTKTESWAPALDILETPESYRIKVDVPGIAKENIDIAVSGNVLTVKGEKEEKEINKASYHRKERVYGMFLREISLPQNINESDIKASCSEGVLEIEIPKTEKEKTKKITVN